MCAVKIRSTLFLPAQAGRPRCLARCLTMFARCLARRLKRPARCIWTLHSTLRGTLHPADTVPQRQGTEKAQELHRDVRICVLNGSQLDRMPLLWMRGMAIQWDRWKVHRTIYGRDVVTARNREADHPRVCYLFPTPSHRARCQPDVHTGKGGPAFCLARHGEIPLCPAREAPEGKAAACAIPLTS